MERKRRVTDKQNQRKPVVSLGVGTSGRGEDKTKGCRRVTVVEVLCIHV
jgi:hypothetical protein